MIKTFKRFLKFARCSALMNTGALSMEVVHIVKEFRDSNSVKGFSSKFSIARGV